MTWIKQCECGVEQTEDNLFKHWTDKGKSHECQMAVKCPECGKEEILKDGVKHEIWIRIK